MKVTGVLAAAAIAAAAIWTQPAWAATRLTPANPQPDAAALQPGLAVEYSYPPEVKSLHQARSFYDYGVEKGAPLVGFDYIDTAKGEPALTSKRAERVAAFIEGYMRFDAPGVYRLTFQSNDGLHVILGGESIYVSDSRHPCDTEGWVEVEAPEAGWYDLEAVFFQRLNTSCLLLEWTRPDGVTEWTPNENFAHSP